MFLSHHFRVISTSKCDPPVVSGGIYPLQVHGRPTVPGRSASTLFVRSTGLVTVLTTYLSLRVRPVPSFEPELGFLMVRDETRRSSNKTNWGLFVALRTRRIGNGLLLVITVGPTNSESLGFSERIHTRSTLCLRDRFP